MSQEVENANLNDPGATAEAPLSLAVQHRPSAREEFYKIEETVREETDDARHNDGVAAAEEGAPLSSTLEERASASEEVYKIEETSPDGRWARYVGVLGRGSFKHVYRGIDLELGKEIAWNVVSITSLNRRDKMRVINEVKLLKEFDNSCEHIIDYYGSWFNSEKEEVVFITELFSCDLRTYMKRIPLIRLGLIKRWCRQILGGIQFLHKRNIIHRDIKLDNIFVQGHTGRICIGDLGVSIKNDLRRAHSILGTPSFMAPELYQENYNEKVDVYAFGMCLLEMVTLEEPYSECKSVAEVMAKVTQGELPTTIQKIQSHLRVRSVIESCLDENPVKRPSCAALLASEFLVGDEDDDVTELLIPAAKAAILGSDEEEEKKIRFRWWNMKNERNMNRNDI